MNAGGFLLGALWVVKLYLRHVRGLPAARWTVGPSDRAPGRRWDVVLTRVLFAFTLALLGFTLVSAINARATYDPASFSFIYHEAIDALPSSLDRTSTWFAFWQYPSDSPVSSGPSAIGCSAKPKANKAPRPAVRRHDDRACSGPTIEGSRSRAAHPLPARLRGLLWVLCVNGALLGIEGIIQRLEGRVGSCSWCASVVNPGADTQFGPWAYRATRPPIQPALAGLPGILVDPPTSGQGRPRFASSPPGLRRGDGGAVRRFRPVGRGAVISLALALLAAVFFGSRTSC